MNSDQNNDYKTVVKVLPEVFSRQLENAMIWSFAHHHPKEFLEAAAAAGCPSAILGNVDMLKIRVTELANQDKYSTGKVALIKAYRTITGMGLKEAKDWVEAHMVC